MWQQRQIIYLNTCEQLWYYITQFWLKHESLLKQLKEKRITHILGSKNVSETVTCCLKFCKECWLSRCQSSILHVACSPISKKESYRLGPIKRGVETNFFYQILITRKLLNITLLQINLPFGILHFVCSWWNRVFNITSLWLLFKFCNYVVCFRILLHASGNVFVYMTHCEKYSNFYFH